MADGARDPVDAVNRGVNGVLAGLAGVALFVTMVVIVGNMVLRAVATPFPGAFEVVGWLAAITSGLAVGYTQLHRGHVDIDILTRALPFRVQAGLQAAVTLVSAGFFLLLAWRLTEMAARLRDVGTVSESLRVPFHHFVYALALGMVGLTVALLADLVHSARAARRGRPHDDGGTDDRADPDDDR